MGRRVTTTSQPQHAAQIDWGNPITQGLAEFIVSAMGVGNLSALRNYAPIGGRIAAYAPRIVATPKGFALGGTAKAQNANGPTTFPVGLNWTMLAYFVPDEGVATTTGIVFSGSSAATSSANNICQTDGVNPRRPRAQNVRHSGGGVVVGGSIDIPPGIASACVTRFAHQQFVDFWVNGVRDPASQGALTGALPPNRLGTLNGVTQQDPLPIVGAVWNRALSDDEIRSVSANPWQVFQSTRPGFIETAQVAFDGKYRPSADITDGTWTRTPSGPDLFSAIDEPTPDDLDFIASPIAGSTPATMAIGPIPAGAQTLRIRAGTSSGTATLTVDLLDDANVVLGTQTQALTSTVTTYSLNFLLGSAATRIRIGVA